MRVSAVDGNLSASVQIDMCEIGFVLDGKPSPYQGQFEVPDCVIVGSEVAGVNQYWTTLNLWPGAKNAPGCFDRPCRGHREPV